MLSANSEEVRAGDILQNECRTQVFLGVNNFNIAQMDVLCVADEKAVIGHGIAEHGRFGIGVLILGRKDESVFFCAAPPMLYVDVTQPDVFNLMGRDSAAD